MLPSAQVIGGLDAPISPATTAALNPLSTLSIPLALSPPHESSTPTSVPGLTTHVPHAAAIPSPPSLAPCLSMSTSIQGQ